MAHKCNQCRYALSQAGQFESTFENEQWRKGQTNKFSIILHFLKQAIRGDIWRHTWKKHRQSAKVPWHHNFELLFYPWSFHGLGLHLGISHGVGYMLVMPHGVSHFQSSFHTNVSKVTICAQILKWRRFLTVIYRFLTVIHRFLTVILTRGRYGAARAAKNRQTNATNGNMDPLRETTWGGFKICFSFSNLRK